MLKSTFLSLLLVVSVSVFAQNRRISASVSRVNSVQMSKSISASSNLARAQKLQASETDVTRINQRVNLSKISMISTVASPKALFQRPKGTYLPSLIGAEDVNYIGQNYTFAGILGSAYSKPWVFTNKSTNATSYAWAWGGNANYSTTTDLTLKDDADNFLYPGSFFAPELTALNGAQSSKYTLPTGGVAANASLLSSSSILYVGNMDMYGNSSTVDGSGVSIGLFSADNGVGMSGAGTGYFWGTCLRNSDGANGTKVNSIVSVYEKPMSPLTIKDICYFGNSAAYTPVPTTKKLTAAIVKINSNGELTTDTIAKGTITGADIKKNTDGVYLPFVFTVTDKTSGVNTVVYPVISDAFAIILSGLDQSGMDFGLFSDVQNTLESSSYFTKVDAVTGAPITGLFRSSSSGMNVALTMNAYFNYLYVDPTERILTAPSAGGVALDAVNKQSGALVYSFFSDVKNSVTNEDLVWLSTSLPDWITLSYSDQYYEQYGGLLFQFTAAALPTGLTDRSADIKIVSYGAETTIKINQALVSAVNNVADFTVSAIKNSQGYNLSYGDDYKQLQLASLSGQTLESYTLPTNGNYQLHMASWPKGVYLLHFKGLKNKTIKIIN